MSDGPTIRPAELSDAPAIAEIYRPFVELSSVSLEAVAPDAAEIGRRMLSQPRLPWLVAQRSGQIVGYAYSSPHRARAGYRWSVECSVYLDPRHWRTGVARALYEHLFAQLRALGYVSVLAGVTLPNDASVGLHEALGFQRVGVFRRLGFKNGRWHDVGWWQLMLLEPPVVPAQPQKWRS